MSVLSRDGAPSGITLAKDQVNKFNNETSNQIENTSHLYGMGEAALVSKTEQYPRLAVAESAGGTK